MEETEYLSDRLDLLEQFKEIPFLSSFDESYLKVMLELSKLRTYRPDEVITSEGEYDSRMYIIITGRARVMKQDEHITTLRTQGDTFGELAIIDGESRSATVTAEEETTCLAIDASFIDRLSPENRDTFNAVFYKMLSAIL